MRQTIVVAVFTAVAASTAPTARRTDPPIRTTIAAAEAEGRVFPHGPALPKPRVRFDKSTTGTDRRECARPNRFAPDVRAGDFILGGQIGGTLGGPRVGPNKIYWIPLHNPYDYPSTLVARAARLGAPGDTMRFTLTNWAWPVGELKSESFFPSGTIFPRVGTWMVVVTAGDDWGCVIFDVH